MSRSEWVTIVTAIVVVVIISAGLWFYFRQRFVRMAEKVEDAIDAIIDGRELKTEELNKDTLFSKIQLKLEQLSEVTKSAEEKNVKQKEEIQKMVSDISHQLKTPIANITMYNDTILNHDLPAKQQYRFLKIMQKQVEKLDFLVRSLMKMSRLENSMIKLKKRRTVSLIWLWRLWRICRFRWKRRNWTFRLTVRKTYGYAMIGSGQRRHYSM